MLFLVFSRPFCLRSSEEGEMCLRTLLLVLFSAPKRVIKAHSVILNVVELRKLHNLDGVLDVRAIGRLS